MTVSVQRPRRNLVLAVATLSSIFMLTGLLGGCDRLRNLREPDATEVRAIAKDAYLYGYPLIVSYKAMYQNNIDPNSGQYKAPIGVISTSAKLYTSADNASLPNNDLVVSTIVADLRAEPLVLCMPNIDSERYFSVQFVDMNMFNFGYLNKGNAGASSSCVMIAGPRGSGQVPTGVSQLLRSSTEFATIIMRAQIAGPTDLDTAAQLQAGYSLLPLSTFLNNGAVAPAPVTPIEWRRFNEAAFNSEFAPMLNFLLGQAPIKDKQKQARFGRIGIGPAAKIDFEALPADKRAAAEAGFADAIAAIDAKARTLDLRVNGWSVGAPFGESDYFKGDDLLRAASARIEPFGLDAHEAIFIHTNVDSQGAKLDGSAHNYVLSFAAGSQPPVDSFWSLSVYDARSGRLVENALGRYSINELNVPAMTTAPDGALTIMLQNLSPGPEREANWLPAPSGPFTLVLRLYTPRAKPPSILPPGSGSWRPPAVMVAQ